MGPHERHGRGEHQHNTAGRFNGKEALYWSENALNAATYRRPCARRIGIVGIANFRIVWAHHAISFVLTHASRWRPDHSVTCGEVHRTLDIYCFTSTDICWPVKLAPS